MKNSSENQKHSLGKSSENSSTYVCSSQLHQFKLPEYKKTWNQRGHEERCTEPDMRCTNQAIPKIKQWKNIISVYQCAWISVTGTSLYRWAEKGIISFHRLIASNSCYFNRLISEPLHSITRCSIITKHKLVLLHNQETYIYFRPIFVSHLQPISATLAPVPWTSKKKKKKSAVRVVVSHPNFTFNYEKNITEFPLLYFCLIILNDFLISLINFHYV